MINLYIYLLYYRQVLRSYKPFTRRTRPTLSCACDLIHDHVSNSLQRVKKKARSRSENHAHDQVNVIQLFYKINWARLKTVNIGTQYIEPAHSTNIARPRQNRSARDASWAWRFMFVYLFFFCILLKLVRAISYHIRVFKAGRQLPVV